MPTRCPYGARTVPVVKNHRIAHMTWPTNQSQLLTASTFLGGASHAQSYVFLQRAPYGHRTGTVRAPHGHRTGTAYARLRRAWAVCVPFIRHQLVGVALSNEAQHIDRQYQYCVSWKIERVSRIVVSPPCPAQTLPAQCPRRHRFVETLLSGCQTAGS